MSLEVFETEPITEAESKILTSVFQNGTVRKYLKLLAFTASADAVSMPLPTNTVDMNYYIQQAAAKGKVELVETLLKIGEQDV